jgi:hypothetical protein
MNELLEALEIIAKHLLSGGHDPDFCGTSEGRRLSELLYQLTGPRRRPLAPGTPQARVELINRTLALPVDLDMKLTVAVDKSGISRDKLIAKALATVIAEDRLV